MDGNALIENANGEPIVEVVDRKYEAVVTDLGNQLMMDAIANGRKVAITEFAVGDGAGDYYKPSTEMTALKSEKWRGPINSCEVSSSASNVLEVSAICPGDAGGFTIREMAVFDKDGNMIAICNCPATPKVPIADGIVNEMRLELEIALVNGDVIELVVDPHIVTATKADIEALRKEIMVRGRVRIGTKDEPFEENEIRLIVDEMPY